jgi:hypothetical protein
MLARSRDFLMQELRTTQKQLLAAKKRKNIENERYLRTRISELRKEMENAE